MEKFRPLEDFQAENQEAVIRLIDAMIVKNKVDGRELGVGLYMPIKLEAFNMGISEIESRKTGKLLKIHQVEPLVGKQRTRTLDQP
ncbi:MAG: hypothetical protein ABIF87_02835 [Pseudomonadota bacterium]